jgi:pimeloyl-ACP methyl ester carboxylesterase
MMDEEKRRVPTAAGELAVIDAGDPEAPAVVLLSGGFTSSHLWRHVVPMLAPWTRVVAPDLLGSGDSASPADADLSLAAHAGLIRGLLAELGAERFALAGHGHGGGVAQLMALEGGVDAVILVDSIAFEAWPAPGVGALREELAGGAPPDPVRWMRAMLDRGMVKRERLSDADLDGYLRPFAGPDGAERFARVARSFDGKGLVGIEPRLAELDVPAFVLWGEDDAFVPASVAERLGDALPRASIALLPGCGHFLLEDAPETVAPLLFQWLRSRYLGIEHRHEPSGPVTVSLGRRPPSEGV